MQRRKKNSSFVLFLVKNLGLGIRADGYVREFLLDQTHMFVVRKHTDTKKN
jgi:hypothetical protein